MVLNFIDVVKKDLVTNAEPMSDSEYDRRYLLDLYADIAAIK
ncbi:hypothetical protein AHiyo8_02750 [Arthrobacter sp. Hiyo8]|nr:hypothetical protein AHiyo8_02750 [Arthrobacter sp. Hiyo8]